MRRISYFKGMPGRAYTVIQYTMRSILMTKGVMLPAIFLLIPPGIAVYTLLDPQEGMKEWWSMSIYFGLILYLQLLLLLYCLVYGTSIVHRDLESRTMTYLVLRGARRTEVYLWRYIGTLIPVFAMFALSEVLMYFLLAGHGPASDLAGKLPTLWSLLLATLIGAVVYLAFFSMLGILFKHPLMVGILFGFFWEVIMVNIPLNIRKVTMMYYMRSIYMMDPLVTDILNEDAVFREMMGAGDSTAVLLVLTLIFLLVGSFFLQRKDLH
ncbi:MAG: hypothetical protein ACMUIE_09055 [Thermoplasmatota archaeon]